MALTQDQYIKFQIYLDAQQVAQSDPLWQAKFIADNTKPQVLAAVKAFYTAQKNQYLLEKDLVDGKALEQKTAIDIFVAQIDALLASI